MTKELQKRLLSSIILLPLIFFIIFKGSIYFNIFIVLCIIIAFYEWYFIAKNLLLYLIGLIFILFSFFSVYYLRNEGEYNFFLFIVITCIATDIGGYIFGNIFKGPKLTKISTNKTYAGMLGSFVLALIFGFVFYKNLDHLGLKILNI